ncbi:hypothetical protein BDV06DRAFT_198114 [Aspergillus oleicola]
MARCVKWNIPMKRAIGPPGAQSIASRPPTWRGRPQATGSSRTAQPQHGGKRLGDIGHPGFRQQNSLNYSSDAALRS